MDNLPQGFATEKILRTWTFWIPTHEHDECRAYMEGVKLPQINAAPGAERATAIFRDLGDGSTEVAVISIWESMDMIRRFVTNEHLPSIHPDHRAKLIDREPVVRHEPISDDHVFSLMPAEWR
ncbi:MAG: hypothetical protein EOP70_14265 [Variovorax sp.]|jgi:heme-degrading monooxygenase HmoA|nr:MAG: hypothetical protein EOP70_14265 [Variovorax sp.]